MIESSKYNRIQFDKKGVQQNFIIKVESVLCLSDLELAQKLGVCLRTIRDWKKEKITISQVAVEKLSQWPKIIIPKHTVIDWRHHWQKAGKSGGKVRFIKYGKVCLDEEYRKEQWNNWWNKIGKYKEPADGFVTLKKIKIPRKSKLLAEFIGILLGDGHIDKYQITVTLSVKEKDYIKYVYSIIYKLFGIEPTIKKLKTSKAVVIYISSRRAVDFCQKFGFEMGNKVTHQVDIPKWIKENKNFNRECIRGLFDTDGCFFTHTYIVGGKKYSYFKIAFTSASGPLRLSVKKTLINMEFNVRMSGVRTNSKGRDIRIDDTEFVQKYISEIGSHNKKHLDKIEKWKVALNGKAAVC